MPVDLQTHVAPFARHHKVGDEGLQYSPALFNGELARHIPIFLAACFMSVRWVMALWLIRVAIPAGKGGEHSAWDGVCQGSLDLERMRLRSHGDVPQFYCFLDRFLG